jgi:hypothetical protein
MLQHALSQKYDAIYLLGNPPITDTCPDMTLLDSIYVSTDLLLPEYLIKPRARDSLARNMLDFTAHNGRSSCMRVGGSNGLAEMGQELLDFLRNDRTSSPRQGSAAKIFVSDDSEGRGQLFHLFYSSYCRKGIRSPDESITHMSYAGMNKQGGLGGALSCAGQKKMLKAHPHFMEYLSKISMLTCSVVLAHNANSAIRPKINSGLEEVITEEQDSHSSIDRQLVPEEYWSSRKLSGIFHAVNNHIDDNGRRCGKFAEAMLPLEVSCLSTRDPGGLAEGRGGAGPGKFVVMATEHVSRRKKRKAPVTRSMSNRGGGGGRGNKIKKGKKSKLKK